MTPQEKALKRPMMMHCGPYNGTWHMRHCCRLWLEGMPKCQGCAVGGKVRANYPDFVRQAREAVSRLDTSHMAKWRRKDTAGVLGIMAGKVEPYKWGAE